jgi:hypothetical protein
MVHLIATAAYGLRKPAIPTGPSWSRSGLSGSEVDIGVSLLRLRSAAQAEEGATTRDGLCSEADSVLPADPAAPSSAITSVVPAQLSFTIEV